MIGSAFCSAIFMLTLFCLGRIITQSFLENNVIVVIGPRAIQERSDPGELNNAKTTYINVRHHFGGLCFCRVGECGQTAAFTFQGKLTDGAVPASGMYEMQFSLYDAVTGGAAAGDDHHEYVDSGIERDIFGTA